ncbi:MAG: ParA family protein [Synergistaceae bacterium]|nr:ParA family protein [Synergistaceae bacterium]
MDRLAVAALNHKGGVGKTTLAIVLAQIALMKRHKVLAIDLDPQRNLTDGLSFIQGYFKGALRVESEPGRGDGDEGLIVVDCPPALGTAAKVALELVDFALVPVRPDFFSLSNLGVLYAFAREGGKDMAALPLVKVGYDASRLSRMAETILGEKGYPVAGSVPMHRSIPYNVTSGRIWSTGLAAEARRPFEELWARLCRAHQRMGQGDIARAWEEDAHAGA